MERCPFCLGQLISCGCSYRFFYPGYDVEEDNCGLPEDVYKHGLPLGQAQKWEEVLATTGLIPFVVVPSLCARCGKLWPEMFNAEDWNDVVPANLRDEMLCLECYLLVKHFVLAARQRKEEQDAGAKPKEE